MMVLTGLATEQSFDKSGAAQYFLVFNNGKLRVPTTEEAAQLVVAAMYGEPEDDDEPASTPAVTDHSYVDRDSSEEQDEAGVDQV